ncbi:hypothetical protein NL676_037826 [Syzygium grande]|nr:hypothetical protein NL676_037826 [Syzygium grande]
MRMTHHAPGGTTSCALRMPNSLDARARGRVRTWCGRGVPPLASHRPRSGGAEPLRWGVAAARAPRGDPRGGGSPRVGSGRARLAKGALLRLRPLRKWDPSSRYLRSCH